MATPTYFKNINNIKYAVSADKAGNVQYMQIKDYFRLNVIREDIFKEDTVYVTYEVKNGERPDQISYEQYGDEQYYWVILQINGIVDYYNDWPLSQQELESYTLKKYGTTDKAEGVHHYETVETKDTAGNLVLDAGLVVDADFIFRYPDNPNNETQITLSSLPVSVSNEEYERRLNDDKREIQILDPKYIYDYVREYKKLMSEAKVSESVIDISEVL